MRRRFTRRVESTREGRYGGQGTLCLILLFLCLQVVFLLLPLCMDAWGRAKGREYVHITAVGDIMMGTTYPIRHLPPEDGRRLFLGVRDSLKGGDVVFGNLEAPFIDEGTPRKCATEAGKESLCYEFRMPPRYAAYLAYDGFNAVSVANNHILDFGNEGFTSTLKTLETAGIQAVGGRRIAYFRVREKRVALAGFSFSAPPSAGSILHVDKAAEMVRRLKKENDIVIVSFHGGAEGKNALRVSDVSERYAKEMRGNVVRFSRSVIDAGADMVLGHGPHVLRALEIYKGKLIAYSLGSFLVYGRFNTSGPAGMSVLLKATLEADTGNLVSGSLVPLRLNRGGVPSLDRSRASISLIKELSVRDMCGSAPLIVDDGSFFPSSPKEKQSRLHALLDWLRTLFRRASSGP